MSRTPQQLLRIQTVLWSYSLFRFRSASNPHAHSDVKVLSARPNTQPLFLSIALPPSSSSSSYWSVLLCQDKKRLFRDCNASPLHFLKWRREKFEVVDRLIEEVWVADETSLHDHSLELCASIILIVETAYLYIA